MKMYRVWGVVRVLAGSHRMANEGRLQTAHGLYTEITDYGIDRLHEHTYMNGTWRKRRNERSYPYKGSMVALDVLGSPGRATPSTRRRFRPGLLPEQETVQRKEISDSQEKNTTVDQTINTHYNIDTPHKWEQPTRVRCRL